MIKENKIEYIHVRNSNDNTIGLFAINKLGMKLNTWLQLLMPKVGFVTSLLRFESLYLSVLFHFQVQHFAVGYEHAL
jgi:hypothetical protein